MTLKNGQGLWILTFASWKSFPKSLSQTCFGLMVTGSNQQRGGKLRNLVKSLGNGNKKCGFKQQDTGVW